jgi:hypothetical protein
VSNPWYYSTLKRINRTLDKNWKLQTDEMLSRKMEETGGVRSSHRECHVNVPWSKYQVPSAATDLKVIERWK